MQIPHIVVKVEWPALDALVEFLQGKQQAQIDSLTGQVKQLTDSLAQKNADLQGSVDSSKQQ